MADIRINALATTAASTASDDFVAVDGSANGTRKLNAYSPTFGGNLTVSGNAAIGTDVFKIDSTNTRILFGLAAALQGDTVEIAAKSNAGAISLFGRASNNQSVISFRQNGSPTQKAFVQGGDTGLELGAGSSIGLTINSSNNTTLAGNLTVSGTGDSSFAGRLSISSTTGVGLQTALAVSSSSGLGVFTDYTKTSGTARTWSLGATGSSSSAGDNGFALYDGTAAAFRFLVTSNGNFLLGKTIESTNGKLQLADHTTSAGGIGFGTDVSLYRPQAGVLAIDGSQAALYLRDSGTTKGRFNVTASTLYIDGVDASGSTGQIILRTGNGGGTALTLDSSQNATFAGTDVTVNGGSTSSNLTLKRASNSFGAVVNYNTTTTNKWFHGLRGLTNDNWYLYNNVAGNNALIFDAATSDATFAALVKTKLAFEAYDGATADRWQLYTYTDKSFRWNYNGSGSDELSIDTSGNLIVAGSMRTGTPTGGTASAWKFGKYNTTAPSATGYVEVDIGGTLYKLLAST